MKDYIVEVKMSETYGISADSPEEAEEKARDKIGNNYFIDEIIIDEIIIPKSDEEGMVDNINPVRKRILKEVAGSKYIDFGKHKDLVSFCVCDGYLCYNPDTHKEEESDFDELIVIVEKDWLFDLIKRTEDLKTDEEARDFLQEVYTSDDSSTWYEEAILANKIVMVDFN